MEEHKESLEPESQQDITAHKQKRKKRKPFRANKVLNWIVVGWLCLEVGQFAIPILLSLHSWTASELMWLFWIALSTAFALGLKLVDLLDERCCPDDKTNDHF